MPAVKKKQSNMLFEHIGLVLRQDTPAIEKAFQTLACFLIEKKISVYVEAGVLNNKSAATEIGCHVVEDDTLQQFCDLVVVLGGDGTLLSIARKLTPFNIPLTGINQGRLGFMTDIPKEHMIEAITEILAGKYILEKRIMLEAAVVREGEEINHALALNDVVFSRGSMGQMIEFEVFIDRHFVYSQRSDGLIVSTPTGSTAYALSAGGPILHPTLPALTLVPICPQSMSNRPIVVNDDVEVEFLLTKGGDTRVHFDGHDLFDLKEMDQIFIRRYHNQLQILHPENYDYYNTLRQKLHWGGRLV